MLKAFMIVAACLAAAAAYAADSVIVGGKEFNLNIPFCGT
jgi:hypothetical protein